MENKMKYIKIWLLMALIVIISAVSFYLGRNYEASYGKTREDASKMSDMIRCYSDTSSDSIFKDIQNEFLEGIDLKEYTYCY